ncbi:hypothetical protein [Streptomyces sp. NPDC002221]|uniref:hypothetical protein n=1 Tax=Streptomyces sp. NPDC002221 TaxID=3364639 RepID=UPI00367EF403
MDQNQRRARAISMRQGKELPHIRTAHDSSAQSTSYFIQSRPAPGEPWQQASGVPFSWESRDTALDRLADRRRMQPSWEHRLMRRTTTVTEQPEPEENQR